MRLRPVAGPDKPITVGNEQGLLAPWVAEAFWRRVERGLPDECWLWSRAKNPGGYGVWSIARLGRQFMAHRVAWTVAHGAPIPKGLSVDHLCRHRACVNPWHLEVVTIRENIFRGTGVAAQNAKKTHCKRGHALAGANLVPTNQHAGWMCRACWLGLRREGAKRRRRAAR